MRVGTDLGKVLVGIQVPPAEHSEFDRFLQSLGFAFTEETENETYRAFLLTDD
jgi:threonine dehydratase